MEGYIALLNMSIAEFVDWHVGRYVGKSVSPPHKLPSTTGERGL